MRVVFAVLCAVCAGCLLPGGTQGLRSVVLSPINNGSTEAALIIVQGAQIDGLAYKPLATRLQEASSLRLWVVLLTGFIGNMPNPLEIPRGVDQAISALKQQGMESDNVFLAGHSLGGVFVGLYGSSHADKLKGVALFGSYLTSGHPLNSYPLPVLHISGDLDGMTRITRIAETFQQLQTLQLSDARAKFRMPVVVMRGVNHGQFASGVMPPSVKSGDLKAEVTSEVAHGLMANHTAAFIAMTLAAGSEDASLAESVLDAAYKATWATVQPLLTLKALDDNVQGEDGWGRMAQHTVARLSTKQLQVNSKLESGEMDFWKATPRIDTSDSIAKVTTFGYAKMPFNPMDVSSNYYSPEEISVKLMSRQAISKALGLTLGDEDADVTCMDLNKLALSTAQQVASPLAAHRYNTTGRPILFQADDRYSTELTWTAGSLDLQEDDAGLHVRSAVHVGGDVIFCKLLSPYRAAEWMYVDSLRVHPSKSI